MKVLYFDNAATSHYKPKIVLKTFKKTLKQSANPGRSGHKLSIKNAYDVWQSRETVARYFGEIEPENVIFTKNCTEALNIVLFGTVIQGGNVVCSCFEHNSVLRPLHKLQEEGKITLTIVYPKKNNIITKKDIEAHLNNKTYLVCVNSLSNVTGNRNDIFEIAKLCYTKNILYLCDNAQGAGHINIDMKKHNISYLTFAGHKGFLTPQGIGGLCINSKIIPTPLMNGGTGTESNNLMQPITLPESLESGTLATPLITSLQAGIHYVTKNNFKHNKKIKTLTEYLYKNLKNIRGIRIYSNSNFESGIIAFNYKDFDSVEITEYLDQKYNIATRGGLHCAPLTHKHLGTLEKGIVRISLSFRNTKKQLNTLIEAIKKLN